MLLGHLGPSAHLVNHPVGEERLDFVRTRPEAGVLVLRHPDRIRTWVRACVLNWRKFGLAEVVAGSAREARLVAAVSLLHDRGDRFGGQVSTDEEGVRIVERGRGQELPKGDLGPVEIGGEEESLVLALPRYPSQRWTGPRPRGSYQFGPQGLCRGVCSPNRARHGSVPLAHEARPAVGIPAAPPGWDVCLRVPVRHTRRPDSPGE